VASRLTLAVINQFAPALAVLAIRELIQLGAERDSAAARLEAGSGEPNQCESSTGADAARLLGSLTALTVGGVWSCGGLGAVMWWLVTGRGPGGLLLATGSMASPAYGFRGHGTTAR
jgi:hypothetical protein